MVVYRLFSERVVTIFVGPARIKWSLHENLLSATSDFFRSAFNGGFKESTDDTLALPEDDPAAFELFVRWLYGKALSPAAGGLNNSTGSGAAASLSSGSGTAASSASPSASTSLTILLPPDRCRTTIQDYLRLYVLASKLLVEEPENTVVDITQGYYKVGTRRPDIRDVQYVYDNTPPGAGMRRLLKERITLGLFRGKHNNPLTPEWKEVMNETQDLGFDIISEISSWNWISGGNCPLRAVTGGCAFHRHDRTDICKI